jgi:hypothetical protein
VPNILSSSLLSKNIKIQIYILYGCETWLLTLREECRLRVLVNRELRRLIGPKRDRVTGKWKNYIKKTLKICTSHKILSG